MKQIACQIDKSWLIRAALVLVVTVLADAATVFTQRPFLLSALVAFSLPVSMVIFVVVPMLRQERRKSQGG